MNDPDQPPTNDAERPVACVLLLGTDPTWVQTLRADLDHPWPTRLQTLRASSLGEAAKALGETEIDLVVVAPDAHGQSLDDTVARLRSVAAAPPILVVREDPGQTAVAAQSSAVFHLSADGLGNGVLTGYAHCAIQQARNQRQLAETHSRLERVVAERAGAIHERARAQEALERSEKRFRDLVETTSDWIWEVDATGVYTYASPKVTELLGYAPEEVVGKTPFDFMPPEEAERVAALFRDVVQARRPFSELENLNLRRDGTPVVLETSGIPILDDDGNLAGYRGIDRDISQRKRNEDELHAYHTQLEAMAERRSAELMETNRRLQQSEQLRDAVLERLPVCISYVDADQRYRYNNRRYEDWFGVSTQELNGQRIRDLLGEATYAGVRPYVERALAGEEMDYEGQIDLPVAGRRWVRAIYVPDHDAQGGVIGYYAIVMDISQRKQAEEITRRHMAELAHAYRLATAGELATELAHELNQPLTTINNYSEACLRMLTTGEMNRTELYDILERISQQAHWAADVIRRLRQFVGPREPQFAAYDVARLVAEVMQLVEADARAQDTSITQDVAQGLPKVRVDAILIEQVILNLVRNALDAMQPYPPEQRHLALTARHMTGNQVQFSVRDTGPGVPPAVAEHLFEPFHSTKQDGMGMGLAISRSIVEAHDGKLDMTSNDDKGTTFSFFLRAAEP